MWIVSLCRDVKPKTTLHILNDGGSNDLNRVKTDSESQMRLNLCQKLCSQISLMSNVKTQHTQAAKCEYLQVGQTVNHKGKILLIVGFGHARVHIFYHKYECVGLCGTLLGCINTAIHDGILQVLWECEAPHYKTTYPHNYTFSNLRGCCWTWSYSVYLPLRRWQWTPSGSHKGCLSM